MIYTEIGVSHEGFEKYRTIRDTEMAVIGAEVLFDGMIALDAGTVRHRLATGQGFELELDLKSTGVGTALVYLDGLPHWSAFMALGRDIDAEDQMVHEFESTCREMSRKLGGESGFDVLTVGERPLVIITRWPFKLASEQADDSDIDRTMQMLAISLAAVFFRAVDPS
jgi:hypothetical protein